MARPTLVVGLLLAGLSLAPSIAQAQEYRTPYLERSVNKVIIYQGGTVYTVPAPAGSGVYIVTPPPVVTDCRQAPTSEGCRLGRFQHFNDQPRWVDRWR